MTGKYKISNTQKTIKMEKQIKKLTLLLLTTLFPLVSSCTDKNNNTVIPPPPPPAEKEKTWKLVFEENFDGNSVNTAEWLMYDSPGHAGNGLRRPEAFTVENGLLVVTAQMKDGEIVSGGMAHRRNYTFGKFEFKVRTEADPSQATSGVVLTWPQSERWPIDGENDIYETLTSASRKPFHTFIHYDADNKQYHFKHEADGKEWQVMAMEWTEDAIKIFRNDKLVWKLDAPRAIPKVPHHICIQLDAFKKVMGDPVKMYVDWVKIYQEEEVE